MQKPIKNITVNLNIADFDAGYEGNGAEDFMNEMLDRCAERFLEDFVYNNYHDKDRDLSEKLEEKIVIKLDSLMTTDFKNCVAEKVTENLTNKFEKTRQYKELVKDEDVLTDSAIKSGLKELVSSLVKGEMKSIFKN